MSLPADGGDVQVRSKLAEELARGYLARHDFARAGYAASWGQAFSEPSRSFDLRRIFGQAVKALPQNLADELVAKKAGHSVEDMHAFSERARNAGVSPSSPADPNPSVTGTGPDVVVSKVIFPDSATGKLSDAPPGVIYHEDRQELEWTPGPFSKVEKIRVLFTITRPDGTEDTYIHAIERN